MSGVENRSMSGVLYRFVSGVEYRLLSSHAGYAECACKGRVEGRRQRHLCAGEGRVERKAGFSATYFILFHKLGPGNNFVVSGGKAAGSRVQNEVDSWELVLRAEMSNPGILRVLRSPSKGRAWSWVSSRTEQDPG